MDDIELGEVDEQLTQSQQIGTMFTVYIKLSNTPDSCWATKFNEQRRYPRHTMWRRAHLESDYIVIECPLDEVPQHYSDLKEDVVACNKFAREMHVQTMRDLQRDATKSAADQDAIHALNKKLRGAQ